MGNAFPGRKIAESTGLIVYCVTVPCTRALDNLARTWQPHEVDRLVASMSICVVAVAAFAHVRLSTFSWHLRAVLSAATAALVLTLLISVPGSVDMRRVTRHIAPRLHLHSCWDDTRCDANNFSVYISCEPAVEGSKACAEQLLSTNHPVPPIFVPPPEVAIAPTSDAACVVVHITPSDSPSANVVPRLAPPCTWREQLRSCDMPEGGHNQVILAMGDGGIEWSTRLAKLGCSMLVQTHMELSNYVPGFDISIPLGLVPGRNGAPSLAQLESMVAVPDASARQPAPRRWWLTFRGTIDYGMREHRAWLLPLAAHSTAARPIVIAAKCAQHPTTKQFNERDANASVCLQLASKGNRQPSYMSLLNTTFALLPGGLQPASFRMDEAMAAGAIPVFVAGDLDSSSPYVRPFEETIPWAKCSFSFPWERAHRIPHVLSLLSDAQIARMQREVHRVWHKHLRPPLAHRRTLYGLLKQRATTPYRRA
jgi:glucuronyl/N-acetylglucosaminyl transferase EXT1